VSSALSLPLWDVRWAASTSTMALVGGSFVTAPPDDLPTASQSTLLLQKRKEMQEVQQQLDRKKEEFRARMQRCQEKEVDLAARQEDIKEQVRKFDKFLKDNDAKRVRADRKVQEEKKASVQKENEKHELQQILNEQNEKRMQLKLEVESKSKYQRFLDSVCEDPSEYFESIENITMRYETLAAAHADLTMRVDTAQKEQEEENQKFVSFVKTSQNDLLVYNSDIAKKQQDIDHLRYTTTDREAALSKGEVEAKEGTRQLGEIKMAINNIYNRCVRVRGPTPEAHEAILDAIKQRCVDLQSIVTGHERPVGLQELSTIIRNMDAAKAKLVDPNTLYAVPERASKPAAAAGGGSGPADSTSPGSTGPAGSKAARGSTAFITQSGASASGAGLSGGPVSLQPAAAS